MKLNYGQEVFTLPAAVLTQMDRVGAPSLRVLLWLASDGSLAEKKHQLAKLCDCTVREVTDAISFWQEQGVLAPASQDEAGTSDSTAVMASAAPVADKPAVAKPLRQRAELPTYTTDELAKLLEQRASARALLDEGQRILGKMFTTADTNRLLVMWNEYGMDEASILLLLDYCKRIGKTNLGYIAKIASELEENGITEHHAMEEELRTREELHSFEGEVRKLFGMKSRALTTKESKMLRAWHSFGYGVDVVRLAYEITVDTIHEPSVQYANGILEKWNAEGLHTVEEIQAAEAAYRAKKEGKPTVSEPMQGNSFDTDEFLEAALKRSFEQMGIEE